MTSNTVVITGGSQGVGRAAALIFARNGYNVVIAARNPEKLAAADAQLGTACSRAEGHLALSTDITDEAAVQRLVEAVTAKYETVTMLINCAGGVSFPVKTICCMSQCVLMSECSHATGVCLNGSVADTSVSDFIEQMNVNFLGAVAVTKGPLQRAPVSICMCHGLPPGPDSFLTCMAQASSQCWRGQQGRAASQSC